MMGGRQEQKVQAEHEQKLAHPLTPDDPNYEFMMDDRVVGKEAYYSRPKPHRQIGDHIIPNPVASVQAQQEALAHTEGNVIHEKLNEPERVSAAQIQTKDSEPKRVIEEEEHGREIKNEENSAELRTIVKKEEKEVHELHSDFTNLEKLSHEQLVELREINKHLKQQIEQAELDSEAARRETKHPGTGPTGLLSGEGDEGDGAGKNKDKKEGGGLLSKIESVLEFSGETTLLGIGKKFGKKLLSKVPGVGKYFKGKEDLASKAAKTGEEIGEAGKVAKTGEEAVEVASKVEKAEGLGSKILEKGN